MKKSPNLLPPLEKTNLVWANHHSQISKFGIYLIVSLLVTIAACGVGFFAVKHNLSASEKLLVETQREFEQIQETGLAEEIADINLNMGNYGTLSDAHVAWSPVLIEFAKLVPSDVAVTTISIDRETLKVELTGKAALRESVLELRKNIINSTYFHNINFPLFNLESPREVRWKYRFYIRPEILRNP